MPEEVLPLLDVVGVFRHESREWARQLGKAARALGQLPLSKTRDLPPGVLWLWARDWHVRDAALSAMVDGPVLVEARPRLSRHGGASRTAMGPAG